MVARLIDHVVWAVHDLAAASNAASNLGFCVTPRAQHPESMGTANQLVQFSEKNFIEFLEVDRPATAKAHDPVTGFGFGTFNQDFLKSSAGISMLVFRTNNAAQDALDYADLGLAEMVPFEFGRKAIAPNGEVKNVAFKLAIALDPTIPELACFTCQNCYPENFWKSEFQSHPNQSTGIRQILIRAVDPEPAAHFLAKAARSKVVASQDQWIVDCADQQKILIKGIDNGSPNTQSALSVWVESITLNAPVSSNFVSLSWGHSQIRLSDAGNGYE